MSTFSAGISCTLAIFILRLSRYFLILPTHHAYHGTMKSYSQGTPGFNIPSRRGFVNITPEIVELHCRESGASRKVLVLCNAMHITASVFINDNESGLHQDFEKVAGETLVPEKPHSQYAHNGSEDKPDAHLKRTVMGREVVVARHQGENWTLWVNGRTNFLRGIRRQTPETGAREDYRGSDGISGRGLSEANTGSRSLEAASHKHGSQRKTPS